MINSDYYSTPKDKKSSSKSFLGSLLPSLGEEEGEAVAKEDEGEAGNDGDKGEKKCQGKKHSLGKLRPGSCLVNINPSQA